MKRTENPATPDDLAAFRQWLPITQAQLAEALGIAAARVSAQLRGRAPIGRARLLEWSAVATEMNAQLTAERKAEAEHWRRTMEDYLLGRTIPAPPHVQAHLAKVAAFERELAAVSE